LSAYFFCVVIIILTIFFSTTYNLHSSLAVKKLSFTTIQSYS